MVYIHNAIRADLAGMDQVSKQGWVDRKVPELRQRYKVLRKILKVPEAREEEIIFPRIAKDSPDVAPLYAMDYRANDDLVHRLGNSLVKGDTINVSRAAAALSAQMHAHLAREENTFSPCATGTSLSRSRRVGKRAVVPADAHIGRNCKIMPATDATDFPSDGIVLSGSTVDKRVARPQMAPVPAG